MPVKIRLQRKGRKKRPFYHIVIADARSPRDGKFIEKIGTYNPLTKPATIDLDSSKAYDWLMKGAQPTDTVRAILKFRGVFYRKHLQRGVAKGAFSQEEADRMHEEWMSKKEATVEKRRQQTEDEAEARRRKIFGEPPARPQAKEEETKEETPAEETPAATEETTEAPAEENNTAEEEKTAE